jgi:hypothetical protein
MLLKLTTLPRAPSCTQSTNDKTTAQLETEEHGLISVHLVRSSPPTATLAGLNDNFKAFMVAKIPSSKPLDPSIFVVSFNRTAYTLNIPKSLVPMVLALGRFTINKEDTGAKYLFETKEVTVVSKGTDRASDDNWCTVLMHKHETAPIGVIREHLVAHLEKHGFKMIEGKGGFNPDKKPKISSNFNIPDQNLVYRHHLKSFRTLTITAHNNVWLGPDFCKEWKICEKCHGTNSINDYNPGCNGRCDQNKKRKAPEASTSGATSFGTEEDADF